MGDWKLIVTRGGREPDELFNLATDPYEKTNLASAVIALTKARDAALNAQVTLAQLLGIDPRTPVTPATSGETLSGP